MAQRVSDREEASGMAPPKRTRSFSPSSSGPTKRSRSSRKQSSSQSKEPTTFFQRILKTFTSQSQNPQLTTDDESSYSSATDNANTVNIASTSAAKQRNSASGASSAGTPRLGQSDSDNIGRSSQFEGSSTNDATDNSMAPKRRGRPKKLKRVPRLIVEDEDDTTSASQSEGPKKKLGRPPKVRNSDTDDVEKPKKRMGRPPKNRPSESESGEVEKSKKRLGRPPKIRTSESEELVDEEKKPRGRPPKKTRYYSEITLSGRPRKRMGRPPKVRTSESDASEKVKKPIGRPRKHPHKLPGAPAPVGRPRMYPVKEPGPKRPLGRPRKVIATSSSEEKRPRGRPRLSKTTVDNESASDSSEDDDEDSGTDENEEGDDEERLARMMTKSPFLRNEEDFILSDIDSADEVDAETKKMALADAREDSPFEEKLMYDTRTKTYFVKDDTEKRRNVGGLGFKDKINKTAARAGRKQSSRDTDSLPSIILETEASGSFPIFESNYRLTHILRGPSKILFPNRDGTKDMDIWAVEFEPGIGQSKELEKVYEYEPYPALTFVSPASSNIAAVCGGDTVELIDASLGRVIKRYSHVENKEEFYCLAWTTLSSLDTWEQEKPYNILAAAGELGTIKLFNPTQSECYRYLFGHSKEVSRLMFSKTKPRWLLSASGDMTVRLWDIGSAESNLDTSILGALTINRLRSAKMAAMIKFKPGHKRRGQGMVQFGSPMAEYPVSEEWHESYVDDILMVEKLGNDRSVFQCIISRASSDEEFIMWNPVKSTRKDADILSAYEWPESPASCLRMKLYEAAGEKAVISGDCEGNIQIYDVGNGNRSKDLPDGSKERQPPKRTLSHSQSTSIIRDVSFSHNMEYLVSVDASNRVYVWKATTPI
ncbi:hypothetical protein INT44_006263 [Umbelopsis vinacea]|uniref:Leucine-rich repeat and WD repeat-containing protein 1 WD domain-containing protein n=1 Tax=Umbelopsis vinacea TaxID=44442 RepID=A0A8H7PSE4_9FUNG|nr:hypothetical protein INT44_006263 [Umbelopsis vinacea]